MQRNCIFPGRYAPLTYYDWLRGRPRNTLSNSLRGCVSACVPGILVSVIVSCIARITISKSVSAAGIAM